MGQLDLSLAIMDIIVRLIIDETPLVLFSLQMSRVSEVIHLGNCKGHLNASIQRSAFHHRALSFFQESLFPLCIANTHVINEVFLYFFKCPILLAFHNPILPLVCFFEKEQQS